MKKLNKRSNLISTLALIGIGAVVYAVIVCAWVGAEYLMEGAVHMGKVDSVFAVAGAYFLTRDWYYFQSNRKLNKSVSGLHEK